MLYCHQFIVRSDRSTGIGKAVIDHCIVVRAYSLHYTVNLHIIGTSTPGYIGCGNYAIDA